MKRGSDLVLFLYWQAIGKIDQDHTVFAHLVNDKGKQVLGDDSQPRGGNYQPILGGGQLVVDAHLPFVPPEVPLGKYRLEVGLYCLPTMERLSIFNAQARGYTDQVVIEPFWVE